MRWVDRRDTSAGTCSDLGATLVALGALTGADAIRARGADKILFVEGDLDKSLLGAFFERAGHRDIFSDPGLLVVPLLGGKGDAEKIPDFQRYLQATLHVSAKMACIVDCDYELEAVGDTNDTSTSGVVVHTLNRKEVENYLLEPSILARAARIAADARKKHTQQTVAPPTQEEIEKELKAITNSDEIRGLVECQLKPQYRASLDIKLHSSDRESRADAWFNTKWANQDWRLERCPGKRGLALLRSWCQETHGLSLGTATLLAAVEGCPPELDSLGESLSAFFFPDDAQPSSVP